MRSEHIRIHDLLPKSHANGPGPRAVVWVQGCSLGCKGCFNPQTHAKDGGRTVPIDTLVEDILTLRDSIQGLTISGGEPLQQLPSVRLLLRGVRMRSALSTLLFTGYTWREMTRMPDANRLLDDLDVVVAGRYDATRRLVTGLRSSANQTTHFLTDRYTSEDLQGIPTAEVTLSTSGDVVSTGIDPLILDSDRAPLARQ